MESVHTPLFWAGGSTKALVWVPSSTVSEEDQRWFASKPPAWHAVLFWVVNSFFAVGGAVVAGVGINLATETSGAIFGLLPGTLASCLGLSIVALALFGVLGERCQIRLMLLIYFVLVLGLILAQLAGLLALAIRWGTFDPIFSSYWGDYDKTKREEGQVTYDCCGYNDRYDRPAGNCSATVPSCCDGCGACEGCKTHALNKLYAQSAPLLIGVPCFLIAQVGGGCARVVVCVRAHARRSRSCCGARLPALARFAHAPLPSPSLFTRAAVPTDRRRRDSGVHSLPSYEYDGTESDVDSASEAVQEISPIAQQRREWYRALWGYQRAPRRHALHGRRREEFV